MKLYASDLQNVLLRDLLAEIQEVAGLPVTYYPHVSKNRRAVGDYLLKDYQISPKGILHVVPSAL